MTGKAVARRRLTLGLAAGAAPALVLFSTTWLIGTRDERAARSVAVDGQVAPERVAPGVVSTAAVEHNAAFTPDGRTMYFTRQTGRWGDPDGRSAIYVTRHENGEWSAPEALPFTGSHSDSDAYVSPDGRRLLFISTRAHPEGRGGGRDVWVYPLYGDSAREPEPVGGEVNSPGDEYSPVLTPSGTLYFASTRAGGRGRGDLYAARSTESGFGPVRNLGPVVNSPFGEWNLAVDPSENVLLFESSGRALNLSMAGDLYVAFRDGAGWTAPAPLDELNTPGSDLMPRFSPDGADLYYASSLTPGSGHTDIFRVPLAARLARARRAPRSLLLAVSRSAHHVAIVDPQTLRIERRFDTAPGPHEVAALPGGRAVVAEYGVFPRPHESPVDAHPGFDSEPAGNSVRLLDLLRDVEPVTIELPGCTRAHGILGSGDGSLAWATCEDEAAVVEIDLEARRVVRRWDTGRAGSHRLVSTHDDRFLVVANVEAGGISVIDRSEGTRTVLDTGAGSEGLAVSNTGTVWVLASGDRTLSEVDPVRGEIVGHVRGIMEVDGLAWTRVDRP